MKSRAEVLERHGFGVLMYDLRGHGESEGDVRAFGWRDVEDVKNALEFLSNREEVDPNKIGILGFSIGGQIAIRATAEYKQIKAIIADDPGFVTVDDAPTPSNTKGKILHMVSWVDGRGVVLWIWEIPEAYHGGEFEARPLEYEEKMTTFFNDALLKK